MFKLFPGGSILRFPEKKRGKTVVSGVDLKFNEVMGVLRKLFLQQEIS